MRPPSRDELDRLEQAERFERYRLPVLFSSLLLIVMLARFNATRAVGARLASYGLPVVFAAVAAARFAASDTPLRTAIYLTSGAAVVGADLAVLRGSSSAPPWLAHLPELALPGLLITTLLVAALLQGAAARSGRRTFLSAWLGMVAMWGIYFPGRGGAGGDAFGAVLAAAMVSLFAGGGGGLVLGAVATRIATRGA